MIHQALFNLVARPNLYVAVLLIARVIILTGLETLHPAHRVLYRRVWWRDGIAFVAFTLAIVPAALMIDNYFAIRPVVPDGIIKQPLVIRFLLYLIIADFGHYWIHRLMHTKHLWRIHKWHHVPTYMYWLAGARGSLLQQVIVNLPYIFAGVLLNIAPWWMVMVILTKNTLQNDWMHLNVPWGWNWLEWIIVTPRYHHIHHSDKPEHYRANLAALFPIWDRLFGTYVNPQDVPRNISFGIGEHVGVVRLAIGV